MGNNCTSKCNSHPNSKQKFLQMLENGNKGNKKKLRQAIPKNSSKIFQQILLPKNLRTKPQYSQADPKQTKQISEIISQTYVVTKISNILKEICYTKACLTGVSDDVRKLLIKICYKEKKEEVAAITKLLNDNKKRIQKKQIHYQQLKEMWKKENKEVRESHFLRIFYNFANIVGACDGYKLFPQITQKQMEDRVELEETEYYTEQFGQIFYFSLERLKHQTIQIQELLYHSFSNYTEYFLKLQYNLQQKQTLQMAKISREACNYHERGIFILLVYFVKSSHKLQKQGKTLKEIEDKMATMLKIISDKYPPGSGLEENEQERKALEKMEKKQIFETKPIILEQKNKREQLKAIIVQNSYIAAKNKQIFEDLIRSTCLKRSIAFKTGLKYNPAFPNQKAEIRIQEKMFFKNKSVSRSKKKTINEILQDEEQIYKQTMEKELEQVKQVQFLVSDMVRGKCTFSILEEIIQTVCDINRFIESENQKCPGRYRITSIESRFTRSPPISDITLKIALNEEIVSQLQLTIQNNVASYNFAHKIYQFNRSKVFSKIKIVHNYYQEYQYQYDQLIQRTLFLAQKNKQSEINKYTDLINNFFEIEKYEEINLKGLLINQIFKRRKQQPQLVIKNSQQLLMSIVFDRKMRMEERVMARQARQWLAAHSQQCTKVFVGVMFFQFFKDIDVTEAIHDIKALSYEEHLNTQYGLNLDLYQAQLKSSSKIYLKFTELNTLLYIGKKGEYKDNTCQRIIQMIYGEYSIQNLKYLTNYGKMREFYEQSHQIKDIKSIKSISVFQSALKIAQKNALHNLGSQTAKIQLLLAQTLLKQKIFKKASSILVKIQLLFKQKQQSDNLILSQLLLAECTLYEQKLQEFSKKYKSVLNIASIYGLTLKGVYIAETEWRIGLYLWKQAKQPQSQIYKKQAFDVHFRLAIKQFSSYLDGQQLFDKMRIIWPSYKAMKLEEPKLKQNQSIKKLNLSNRKLEEEDFDYLSKTLWPNLTQIKLSTLETNGKINRITDKDRAYSVLKSLFPKAIIEP